MPLLKKIVFSLGTFAVVGAMLLGVVLVGEWAVRITLPMFSPSSQIRFVRGLTDKPTLGPVNTVLRQTKNTGEFDVEIRFNRHGFRDSRDISKARRDGIIMVGDSISFGWGVEEVHRLSERLEKSFGKPVYNISMPGNLNMTERLIRYAGKLGARAQTVIIVFAPEARLQNYHAESIKPISQRSGSPLLRMIKEYLTLNSALYTLLTSFVHQNAVLRNWAVDIGLITTSDEGIPLQRYDQATIDSSVRRLREITFLAKRSVIVLAPARGIWNEKTSISARRIHKALVHQITDAGLDVVDPMPAFEKGGNVLDYFYKTDGHWSPAGHALVADLIAARLNAPAK